MTYVCRGSQRGAQSKFGDNHGAARYDAYNSATVIALHATEHCIDSKCSVYSITRHTPVTARRLYLFELWCNHLMTSALTSSLGRI